MNLVRHALENKRWYWHYKRLGGVELEDGGGDWYSMWCRDQMESFRRRAWGCIRTAKEMRETRKRILAEPTSD